jgi:hypothetical protein
MFLTCSSWEPGRANRTQEQHLIAAASIAFEQLFWPTADEAGLLILVKPVFLNAILVGTGYYKPCQREQLRRSAAELFTTSPRRLQGARLGHE